MLLITHKNIKNNSQIGFISDCIDKISKADIKNQIMTKNIEMLLYFFTLKGCTHFKGENFKIINKLKTNKLIISLVENIKKYKTTIFQIAGKPL